MSANVSRETSRRLDGILEAFAMGNAHEHELQVRRLAYDLDRAQVRLTRVREIARTLGQVSTDLDETVYPEGR